MARLIKTKVEWEGMVRDEYALVEGQAPAPYPPKPDFKTVGKNQPRIDGTERVTGRAQYTLDVHLPGMLYARVLRSLYPHARIKKIDVRGAATLPGVRGIVSYQNV